jgi:hypothetical protein
MYTQNLIKEHFKPVKKKKLDIDLPFDPAIPLLGIYPKDCNTGYSRGICTPMLIAALFTIAKL